MGRFTAIGKASRDWPRVCISTLVVGLMLGGLAAPAVGGEIFYVRKSTTGANNGTSWANAWRELSDIRWGSGAGRVGAGDVVYVAGGNYTRSLDPQASGSGPSAAERIIIRRATRDDHGPDPGWQDSYDGIVKLLGAAYINIDMQNYITVDGVTEWGFVVESPTTSPARGIAVLGGTGVLVQYIKTDGAINGDDFRGMWLTGENNVARYCWFANCPNDAIFLDGKKHLIEYCILGERINSASGKHADAIEIRTTSDITFRYNRLNWRGDGIHFGINASPSGRWDIHGNIFTMGPNPATANGLGALKTNSKDPSVGPIYIYNNTFYNVNTFFRTMTRTFGVARNNILYNVININMNDLTHDYNWFSGGSFYGESHGIAGGAQNPFVNLAQGNVHLVAGSSPVNRGMTLPVLYQLDAEGRQRGSDGAWDIGAWELDGLVDNEPPSVPTDVTAAALTSFSINLSWTASFDNVRVAGYRIYCDGSLAGESTSPVFEVTNLHPMTEYVLVVVAYDSSNNESVPSNPVTCTTPPLDAEPPSVPPNLTAQVLSPYRACLQWDESTDNLGVEGYTIYRDGVQIATVTGATEYTDYTLMPQTDYYYSIAAFDGEGNFSDPSLTMVSLKTPAAISIEAGLVAFYDFNEGDGTTLIDHSGHGNHGRIVMAGGAEWPPGKSGTSLLFNGQGDLVVVDPSPSLTLTTGMTLIAWVFPTDPLTRWRHVIARQNGSTLSYYLAANSGAGVAWSGFNMAGVWRSTGGGEPLDLFAWSNIASTYDGQTLLVYIDGQMVSSLSIGLPIESSTDPLHLGGNILGEFFKGRLDDVRIYNRVLDQAEIRQLLDVYPSQARQWELYE